MKKFFIVYERNGARFLCQHEAPGIHTALDKFEAVQKLPVDCIVSIDVVPIRD